MNTIVNYYFTLFIKLLFLRSLLLRLSGFISLLRWGFHLLAVDNENSLTILIGFYQNLVASLYSAGNHHLRDGVTQLLTDDTQNRTCTILLVVASQGNLLTGLRCQRQLDVLLLKQFQQSLQTISVRRARNSGRK